VGPEACHDLTTSADDEARFEEIYRTYRLVLHRFCERRLGDHAAAADVVHETLLRCWKHRHRLHAEMLPGWLFSVARNLCIDTARARRRLRPTASPLDDGRPPQTEAPKLDAVRLLADALGVLDDRQRRLFQLHYIDGVGYEDLAAEMCSTVGSLRVSMFRAKHRFLAQFAYLGLDDDTAT
jgi:RNA polymerase sigma factor (sigma-70 family)